MSVILQDVNPFGPLVFKTHYDGWDYDEVIKAAQLLVDGTIISESLEGGNSKSSVSNEINPHRMKQFSEFYKWVTPLYNNIAKVQWNIHKNIQLHVGNSWVNYHDNTGYTKEHHHGASVMVITSYLNLPENGGFIEFRDPLEGYKGFLVKNTKNSEWVEVPAKTGDVFIFPAWLRHRVQPNTSNERRWVLTTNIDIK